MILAIETATTRLGVALIDGDVIRASMLVNRGNAHDELLAPLCSDIVAHAGLTMRELTGLAVSAGPGSFTGLRIGLAVAKGMALALDIPLALVPTHDAIAAGMAHSWAHVGSTHIAVCIDAKRDDIYAATYHLEGNSWSAEYAIHVCDAGVLLGELSEGTVLVGDGAAKVHARAPHALRILPDPAAVFDARFVALLGARMLADGMAADPDTCEPLYVQEFEVKPAKNILL
ncbi:MAG: tRNA (adenosine(37)-N6)-threonylcarbamoyltransferase complex dimerization subunit type 1 TsaB [Bacteroidetes bacterium]|nr:tRNA (adenosine(37)-N6)-threonylcarbamoyltransferase complex dimerization subunit type 1 TsaB [Bacteroidota bacterium]